MGTWSDSAITTAGQALQAKLLSTDALQITRVVSGAGRVASSDLESQTSVKTPKDTLTVESLSYSDSGQAIIKAKLNNLGIVTAYTCFQVGIYATDPDDGEILYAIIQDDTGEHIPSISECPAGFTFEWCFHLAYSNSDNVTISIDPSSFLTIGAADERYARIETVPVGGEVPVADRTENTFYMFLTS